MATLFQEHSFLTLHFEMREKIQNIRIYQQDTHASANQNPCFYEWASIALLHVWQPQYNSIQLSSLVVPLKLPWYCQNLDENLDHLIFLKQQSMICK